MPFVKGWGPARAYPHMKANLFRKKLESVYPAISGLDPVHLQRISELRPLGPMTVQRQVLPMILSLAHRLVSNCIIGTVGIGTVGRIGVRGVRGVGGVRGEQFSERKTRKNPRLDVGRRYLSQGSLCMGKKAICTTCTVLL